MKKIGSLLLSLLLCAGLLTPFASAEEPQPQPISAWAYDVMADISALGMWSDTYYYSILDPVTEDQLLSLCAAVAQKLAVLELPVRAGAQESPAPLVLDGTRGGVLNALYQEAAPYEIPHSNEDPVAFFTSIGVLKGDGTGENHLDRTCTLQEALVLAGRTVLAVYDGQNAGSLGLLWKAVNGENTLYLLGTIHTDRDNVYPLHRQLRDVISGSDDAVFELDFTDQAGMDAFVAMQVYSDGTALKDHISPELYAAVVEACASIGLSEEDVGPFKPWALANTFQALSLLDETSGESPTAVDMYVYGKAANAGAAIGAVETYTFQGAIFDDLSPEYQEAYLASTLAMFTGEGIPAEQQETVDAQLDLIAAWMQMWKTRDAEAFSASYDKEAILSSSDELSVKLFAGRDPNMIAYADAYLKSAGPHTGILVVGAGHMIGGTGIVQGLKNLGYTVELVPAP